MKPQTGAKAALALGLLIALTANLAYAVPKGPVVVGLGLVAPLVLPVVLVLRTTFTASGWSVLLRELATLAVAGPAVAVSYSHTYSLVLDAGEPWVLALLAPLSSDGLAGLATLALHRMRAGTTAMQAEPVYPESDAEPWDRRDWWADAPEPAHQPELAEDAGPIAPAWPLAAVPELPAVEPLERRPAGGSKPTEEDMDLAIAFAVDTGAGWKRVRTQFGFTEHYSKQAVEAAKGIRQAASA